MNASDRLPFKLTEFTRLLWASDAAKRAWQPRISRCIDAWSRIEVLSVARRCRTGALVAMDGSRLSEFRKYCATLDLTVCPVHTCQPSKFYRTTLAPASDSTTNVSYRCFVGDARLAEEFTRAWESQDDGTIGRLLGYPACCCEFFVETWVRDKRIDFTWAAAEKSSPPVADRTAEVTGPDECNILLRWLGIRAVPHIPCRFDCLPSGVMGKQLLAVGEAAGLGEEIGDIREMLSWSAEWSALHGIAEIRTPIVKVATSTDATGLKYTVRRTGTRHPQEAPHGLNFPYRGLH